MSRALSSVSGTVVKMEQTLSKSNMVMMEGLCRFSNEVIANERETLAITKKQ